ncbi:hypothetical protein [Ornithinibacillus bavariensis]|uniref:Uncharacterized protein n=1 Tax=Ornithinibacillus bavariensis TaxID=545502 RepID=A0A919XCB0_9BACI|nr:hypothetical protein [Ornithinibacillus bavariensis]GIO28282.1 hypothetical protein J43TS3_28930 [Ornithinibacillus bavariensis]
MIKITLWENAYDSIEHGLEHLEIAINNDNAYDYRRAVLDFCHAAELLLKEILFRIDPIYAFDKNDLFKKCLDPLHPTIEELYSCKSLEVHPLCNAVEKYAPELKNEYNANLNVFSKEASKLRNKIQHFCYESTVSEIRGTLLKLSYQLLCPVFSYLDTEMKYDPLEERLYEAFSVENVLRYYKEIYHQENRDYSIGCCYACGSYGLIMTYEEGYPTSCECLACKFTQKDIQVEDYRICPDCGGNSLIYSEELDGGICLWYKCANHKDGGIVISMEMCDSCNDYKIENVCNCTESVE